MRCYTLLSTGLPAGLIPCLVAATFAVEATPISTPSPAARVNGVAVERTAVQELVKGLAQAEPTTPDSERITEITDSALASLIDLELLYQEAVRTKVALAADDVDREVALVRQHFTSEAEFVDALQRRGLTPEKLRLDTRRTMMAERLLQRTVWRDVRVDSDEVERFYDENRAALSRPLDELHDSIAEMLLDDKRATLRADFIVELRKKASIQLFPPYGSLPGTDDDDDPIPPVAEPVNQPLGSSYR